MYGGVGGEDGQPSPLSRFGHEFLDSFTARAVERFQLTRLSHSVKLEMFSGTGTRQEPASVPALLKN
jgi:hypothetical protein